MSTDTFYLSGKCKWARVHEPRPSYDKKSMEYSINLHMDEGSWKLFDSSGLELKKRSDEDGPFITFKCKTTGLVKGEEVSFKVDVIDNDDKPLDKLVGNGSTVTCRVVAYDTRLGKRGHRLEKVKVHDLVEVKQASIHSLDGVAPF